MTACVNLENVRILTAVSNVFVIPDIKESITGNGVSVRIDLEFGIHCIKSASIRSYSGPHFPGFRLE